MSEDLFKRPSSSMDAVTGQDLTDREAAAAEKAAKFTATITSASKPLTAVEKQARVAAEIALKGYLDIKTKDATEAFKDKHLDITLQQLQQTVTFHDITLCAIVRRIFEQGYRSGFAAGHRYTKDTP
ncbi:MAG: hypothetical protein OJI67_08650 [Prosthecobacter sp.]|nr:hypothetical protein [Prosthecobacter sp.]